MSAQSVLETASFVDVTQQLVGDEVDARTAPSPRRGAIRSDRPDVRVVRLRWRDSTWAQARAVLDHFADNLTAFPFRLPNGDALDVVYNGNPTLTRRTKLAVDIDVELHEATSKD